ncbi:hypothetical protein QF042_000391 [Pedobacter sp. W3I1]|nr:hypothetical protein [Pedobacter sp. W3I1]
MALNIYDGDDRYYIVGNKIDNTALNQALVTERRDKYSFPFWRCRDCGDRFFGYLHCLRRYAGEKEPSAH